MGGERRAKQPSKSSILMLDLLGTSPAETVLLYARNCEAWQKPARW